MGSLRPVADTTAVITCYNHQAYVEQCLDSIAAQSVLPHHIIVFDDESTDDSAAVIEHWIAHSDLDVIFHRTGANAGICAVMNRALALVETTSYFHLSADDWAGVERVGVQSASLESAGPGVAFVAGDIIEVDAGGLTLAEHDVKARLEGLTGSDGQVALHRRLLESNIVPAPGVMISTAAAREIGGYDESLEFEDYDLWLRLSESYGIEYSPCTAASYRILTSSLTRRADRALRFLDSEDRLIRKHRHEDDTTEQIVEQHLARVLRAREELLTASVGTTQEEAPAGRRKFARVDRPRATSRSAG